MNYFFGNARNDKGLCATPGCTGKPIHTFVYKYCDRCYVAIASGLESGLAPDAGLLGKVVPLAEAGGTGKKTAP